MKPVNLETFGIELETTHLIPSRSFLSFLGDKLPGWTTTHDASIETPMIQDPQTKLKFVNPKFRLAPKYEFYDVGTEIISPVLDYKTLQKDLNVLLNKVSNCGEPQQNTRTATHIHVSFSEELLTTRNYKNILTLAAHFEALFYYLGGMGYTFRGETNDSIYCRPITKWGPPVISTPKGYAQNFNLKDVLEKSTTDTFWYVFGDSVNHNRKYNQPHRYSWINLLPLYSHGNCFRGALEFRVFNETLDPEKIMACVSVCQEFSKLAARLTDEMIKDCGLNTENSIYDTSKDTVLYLLDKFMSMTNVQGYSMVKRIVRTTPEVSINGGYVFSHKNDLGMFWDRGGYTPPIIEDTGSIRVPEFIDVHRLKRELRSGGSY